MEIINGSERLPRRGQPLSLALGNFDGVHRGHQEIIKAVVREAKDHGSASAALVFDPHPRIALQPESPLLLLTDLADRAEILAELDLDYLVVEPFTPELASLSPEQFVRLYILKKLHAQAVFIGEDYSFGRFGVGSAETMRFWGEKLGFSVHVSNMLIYKQHRVSSSLVRSLLLSGAVHEAADLLNYYFFRHGRVVRGQGLGRRILFPTANLMANRCLLWPGKGVYLSAVSRIPGGLHYGVTNVGGRPTFGLYDSAAETHIFDFAGTLYDREMRICFLEKLRDTRAFSSATELRSQIAEDIERGRILAKKYREEREGQGSSLQVGCSVLRSF